MLWRLEYFEEDSGEQPAEVFEDALDESSDPDERRIAGKLMRIAELAAELGPHAGGGYVEKCGSYAVWQLKADAGSRRGREFFGFDADRIVLLSGVVKGPREPTPSFAYEEAQRHWETYLRTRRVSPEETDE